MPMGPGVDSDTASIFIRSVWLYHPVERPMFFRKGNVMSGSKIKSEILPSVDRMFRNIETWSVTE